MNSLYFDDSSSDLSLPLIEPALFWGEVPTDLITDGLPRADACLFEGDTLYLATNRTIREIKGCNRIKEIVTNARFPIFEILSESYYSTLSGSRISIYRQMEKVSDIWNEALITYRVEGDCLYLAYQNGIQRIHLITHQVESLEKEGIVHAEIHPPYFFLNGTEGFYIATADGGFDDFYDYESEPLAISSNNEMVTFARYAASTSELMLAQKAVGNEKVMQYFFPVEVEIQEGAKVAGNASDLFFSLSKTELFHCSASWGQSNIDLKFPLDPTMPFQVSPSDLFVFPLEPSPNKFRCYMYYSNYIEPRLLTIPFGSLQKAHIFGNKFILSSAEKSIFVNTGKSPDDRDQTREALKKILERDPWNSLIYKLLQQLKEKK